MNIKKITVVLVIVVAISVSAYWFWLENQPHEDEQTYLIDVQIVDVKGERFYVGDCYTGGHLYPYYEANVTATLKNNENRTVLIEK